jgi:ketosteroid isomerase-like protein
MSQENVEIARRAYEQFVAGDMEPVLELFAPDAEVADRGGLGIEGTAPGTRTGPEGFLRATEDTREAFDDYTVEPQEFIDAGDAVVVDAKMSGRGKASGVTLETRVAHLWVFRDRKIVRGEVYRTTDEALDAARQLTE